MNAAKSKPDPIWDFLADSIRIGASQARLVATAHPSSRHVITRTHEHDTIQRLIRMLLLDARRTRAWLRDQDNSIKRCGVFATDRAARAAKNMTNVRRLLATTIPLRGPIGRRH